MKKGYTRNLYDWMLLIGTYFKFEKKKKNASRN